ncbi:hypothetical protein O181_026171 [Austropuccinia psidii MF-1]|uniref:Uncharacterized protein n=1 Tax=Austropuccinia psidii MF-1 TaxID=1389203 RepID=A0A9Q3CPW1_9BASI|nr:hypothetical protein [Austropuccinia psidii MF-1]
MPIIPEPEFELSMSNFNRYKSHSELSNRHIHEPVQAVLYSVQGKGLGNFAISPPRSDDLLEYPEKVPQRGGNSEILQWMESTIIQTSNQKDKIITCQKEGHSKEEAPLASNSKPQVNQPPQEGKKKKKIIGRNNIPQVTGSKKIPWTVSSTWPKPWWNSSTKRNK